VTGQLGPDSRNRQSGYIQIGQEGDDRTGKREQDRTERTGRPENGRRQDGTTVGGKIRTRHSGEAGQDN
jgi:hypothetical protein